MYAIATIARNAQGQPVADTALATMDKAEAWAKEAFRTSIAVHTVEFERHSDKGGEWSLDWTLKTWTRDDYLRAIGR